MSEISNIKENSKTVKICDECGSPFLVSSSKMDALCPNCAHILYGYPNCNHIFKDGKCIKCLYNKNASGYIKKLFNEGINEE
ncbi:hypothetical protein [Treponema pedis]|uniref:hypothetical protein n=1 Tax=Treponema pedis TaxID=409322 RepID=UPI00040AB716|nr:hypothetical protein [Treponema pedis]